ncbi:MAG: iron-containing alcohol dehydrogenase family protein [Deltaproteobacteria bacterium]|nr:iron-containing alcohol dehydrogenase family protein [Deltaproteobacteria bacterium]
MNISIYAVIFLLGGVAAVIVMRLLFLFLNRPFKNIKDDQYLEQIANALQLPKFGQAEPTPRS